ncbi:MAG: efflux RND transporter periplasmic adaptor subunit [Planctomycetaceae bacterium]|nr:efflux RND transporter periplasmic adaptor subunit [Planctomycetaceae bacterium]
MDRADFSNSPTNDPNGRRLPADRDRTAENLWGDVLKHLLRTPEIVFVAIWQTPTCASGPQDTSELEVIAEAGVLNPRVFWQQRAQCYLAALRQPGRVPILGQANEQGVDAPVLSVLLLANQVQPSVGLELQFEDGASANAVANAIHTTAHYCESIGWPCATQDNTPSRNSTVARDIRLPSTTGDETWVWNGPSPDEEPRGTSSAHFSASGPAHSTGANAPTTVPQRQASGEVAPSARANLTEPDYRRFVRQVHASLDPKETAYAVANECRRLIGCERVVVLWYQRGRFLVKAISGQPAVNRRSKWIQLLEQLANRSLSIGQGLDYPNPVQLPPQLAAPLQSYLMETRSRSLLLVPITERDTNIEAEEPDLQKKRRKTNSVIGGLVFESLTAEGEFHNQPSVLVSAQEIGGDALRLAYRHRQLFLYPIWHFLGRTKAMALARRLPTAAIISLVVVGLLALAFFPATFYVSSEGTLLPKTQHRVFAPMQGTVESVLVKPNDLVGVGQPLLKLQNHDLDLKLRQVEGELEVVSTQIDSRRRLDRSPTTKDFEYWDQLEGMPVAVLEARQANLRTQLSLLQQQKSLTVVSSQIGGRVLTWNVQEELTQRPVQMGQLLMEVADTEGEWELELNLPDRRVGHLLNAIRQDEEPLRVEFVMAAEPTRRFSGRLLRTAAVTAASTEDGSYVKVRVALDGQSVRFLQSNTDVSAKIFCGQANLGYLWLQDVLEFAERQVFFYLW